MPHAGHIAALFDGVGNEHCQERYEYNRRQYQGEMKRQAR